MQVTGLSVKATQLLPCVTEPNKKGLLSETCLQETMKMVFAAALCLEIVFRHGYQSRPALLRPCDNVFK